MNTAGKFFERITKSRLEAHLENGGGLSDQQFGFSKRRSTVDSIDKSMILVKEKSTGNLRRRGVCVLVALDVANAFNTANWQRINGALGRKEVPNYLAKIIRSYMSERFIN